MPFLSPKMYSFIFGVPALRLVAECTPASSNCFMLIDTKNNLPRIYRLENWNLLRAPF